MLIDELKEIGKAPAAGHILAYTRKKVLFHSYSSLSDVKDDLAQTELLELHLFDDKCEYRALATESSRYPEGIIEHVADFDFDLNKRSSADVYREDCVLEREKGILTVLNHIDYDENGMLRIDDYRLVAGGENND